MNQANNICICGDINIDIIRIVHWVKNPLRKTSEHNHIYNYQNFLFFHYKKPVFY